MLFHKGVGECPPEFKFEDFVCPKNKERVANSRFSFCNGAHQGDDANQNANPFCGRSGGGELVKERASEVVSLHHISQVKDVREQGQQVSVGAEPEDGPSPARLLGGGGERRLHTSSTQD